MNRLNALERSNRLIFASMKPTLEPEKIKKRPKSREIWMFSVCLPTYNVKTIRPTKNFAYAENRKLIKCSKILKTRIESEREADFGQKREKQANSGNTHF